MAIIRPIKYNKAVGEGNIMGQLLCTVRDTFTITGRGTILIPNVITGSVKVGDAIELRLPGREIIATHIKALESIRSVPARPLGILLPNDVSIKDLVEGVEVWKV